MKGELVYLPCEVMLYKFSFTTDQQLSLPMAEEYVKIKNPVSVLLLESKPINEKFLKVLYAGQPVYVDKAHARKVNKC